MHSNIASSTKTPFQAPPVGTSHIQPPPATGGLPKIYSHQNHCAGTFPESTNFTDEPGCSDTAALNALRYQLRQITAVDSGNQAEVVNVFKALKDNAAVIERTLGKAPDAEHLWRLGDALVVFLRQFNHALCHQPDLSGSLDAQAIRHICLGLSVCASPTAGVVFDAAQHRRVSPALQGITDSLLTQLEVLGMPESASANGMVLDILNWVSRGLKGELLMPNALIRASFGQALELFADWLNGNHSHGFMNVKQIAKCAVQIDLMIKRSLVALQIDTPQGSFNRTLLARCAAGLGSAAALGQLDTGPASSSSQGTVDAIALINVCNTFGRLLEARLLRVDDSALTAPLSRLLGLILRLTSWQMCAGNGQALPNCSNFVRTLFETSLPAQAVLVPMLEKASMHLIETVNGPDFAHGYAASQSISNLMSFVKLCDKRLQAEAGGGKPGQAELINAAGILYGQLMMHDPARFRNAAAISGLLSGLCYLWRRGLVAPTGAERDWVNALMRNVAGMDSESWNDKSRRIMLPALLALIGMGATTLGAAQPALAVLLKEQANGSSGYTVADIMQLLKRLGAIEENVVALPPGVIAQQPLAPAQAPAPLTAAVPRAIPGLTLLVAPPAASLPTSFTKTAPAQRRAPGRTMQEQWKTPARVARNEPLPMSAAEVLASQPIWSGAATSTSASSTTGNATTANSTTASTTSTTSTTNTASSTDKKAKARQKSAAAATRVRPQKPAQQWFALLADKGGIDLKRLQDLARSQPDLVNKNDASGRNALFHAIAGGDEKVVAWLIAHESHVAPAQTAQFLALLMDEVLFFNPAFGAALKCFLERQTAVVMEELSKHFASNPPVMRGVEDILKVCGLLPAPTISVDGRSVTGPLGQGIPGGMSNAVKRNLLQERRKGAKQGDRITGFNLSFSDEQEKGVAREEKEAVRLFEQGARQGNAVDQYRLGLCYENGKGVVKNVKKGVRLYKQAASQGNAGAQFCLGLCYAHGIGVAKNEKEVVRWYALAASQGDVDAQLNLGFYYLQGKAVAKDEKEAVRLYKQAVSQGNAGAQVSLGHCYEQGLGVAKDDKEAVRLYKQAVSQGDAVAQLCLGLCYEQGKGVTKNEKEAVRWYEQAASQGNADAQVHLGLCYVQGLGVTKNGKEAVHWYEQAASQGNADAQINLGLCYKQGTGVAKDEKKAIEWFRKAVGQGHPEAQRFLNKLIVRFPNGGPDADE